MTDLDQLISTLINYDMSWHTVVEVLARHEAAQHISYDALCDKAHAAYDQHQAAQRSLEDA